MARVDQVLEAHNDATVRRLEVRVGEFSGVNLVLFRAAFETFKAAGVCADAELVTIVEPARFCCASCAGKAGVADSRWCQQCDLPMQLLSGGDVYLDRLELATR